MCRYVQNIYALVGGTQHQNITLLLQYTELYYNYWQSNWLKLKGYIWCLVFVCTMNAKTCCGWGGGIVGKSDFVSGILILESIFPNFSEYFS